LTPEQQWLEDEKKKDDLISRIPQMLKDIESLKAKLRVEQPKFTVVIKDAA
jgi:hypothetical protein